MADSLNNINPRDLKDVKDSLIIQEQTTSPLTPNIYDLSTFVDSLKNKYFANNSDTMSMGTFGFIHEMGTNILQNAAIMASEYSNEAIPTRAKFEKNILCHALSLGINKIRAVPAQMEIYLCLPEDRLLENMSHHDVYGDNVFIFDKNFDIHIGKDNDIYTYHVDYDIVVKHNLLRNGKYIYTATYIIDNENDISDITNPYLPNVGISRLGKTNIVMIHTTIRQTEIHEDYKTILVTNPLESKMLTFSFEDQLAYFYVDVNEDGQTHHLKCLYDGLYNIEDGSEYCNYTYIDSKTIRIVFNRDSYQPRQNAEVTIHYVTTKGDECNFSYEETKIQDLNSDRYPYNNIYMVSYPISDSAYGQDKKDIDEIRKIIPQQMLMRNSISTYTDLNNFFNSLNTDQVRLYFLQKVHNQIQRLFFCYILIKDDDNNIMPTNTVDAFITRELFSNINKQNYILQPGTAFRLRYDDEEAVGITTPTGLSTEKIPPSYLSELDEWALGEEQNGFLYTCPFLIAINKNPFLLNYYLNILDYSKNVNFEWINNESELQFIMTTSGTNPVEVLKPFYPEEDRNTYFIKIILTQNISAEFNMITINEDNPEEIAVNNMKVIGVIYTDGAPSRWCEATIEASDYDETEYVYNYTFKITTNNIIDSNANINITDGLYAAGTNKKITTTLPSNVEFKIFILGKLDELYGSRPEGDDIDAIVPGLEEYTLFNVYSVNTGLDLFFDYTNIMESYIEISPSETGEQGYHVKRLPLIRYSYFDTQSRVSKFIKLLEYRRLYVQSSLLLLEDSFGIDMKFFNTYGPSKNYIIARTTDRDTNVDRINISLKFEAKLQAAAEPDIEDRLIKYIKDYLENINYIADLHIPNLTTAVKNEFYKQLVYFKFISLNNYDYMYQSIYKNTEDDDYTFSTTVPEFINIDTKRNAEGLDVPDITIDIIE